MISLFIIVYLLVTLVIGFWASKRIKTSNDFTLAGKNLSTSFVAITLFATWFGSSQIMGNPGYFIKDGFTSYVTLILAGCICYMLNSRIDPTIYGTIASCLSMIIGSILNLDRYIFNHKNRNLVNNSYK